MDTRGKRSQGRGTSTCKTRAPEELSHQTLWFPEDRCWVLCSVFNTEIPSNEILKNAWLGNKK